MRPRLLCCLCLITVITELFTHYITHSDQRYCVFKPSNYSLFDYLEIYYNTMQCNVLCYDDVTIKYLSEYIDPHSTSPPLTPLIIIMGDVLWSDLHQYSG